MCHVQSQRPGSPYLGATTLLRSEREAAPAWLSPTIDRCIAAGLGILDVCRRLRTTDKATSCAEAEPWQAQAQGINRRCDEQGMRLQSGAGRPLSAACAARRRRQISFASPLTEDCAHDGCRHNITTAAKKHRSKHQTTCADACARTEALLCKCRILRRLRHAAPHQRIAAAAFQHPISRRVAVPALDLQPGKGAKSPTSPSSGRSHDTDTETHHSRRRSSGTALAENFSRPLLPCACQLGSVSRPSPAPPHLPHVAVVFRHVAHGCLHRHLCQPVEQ